MSVRKGNQNFHTNYDDNTLQNMKRYYGIDADDEIVKYIKRNLFAEVNEVDYSFKRPIRNHDVAAKQEMTKNRKIFVNLFMNGFYLIVRKLNNKISDQFSLLK
ncbi:MAG TPA: hypothetical protein VFR94_11375 [Nitrososphaeraceae archaeon]|nr:hypothetical protein [Nitrososphaeraceae archaeon]